MILSNIFMPYSKDRDTIDQSTRRIMLVLLREIINNKIEIEAIKETIITTVKDSAGDSHDHRQFYEQGLGIAKAKWASDLADINTKLNKEEVYNEEWTHEYKARLKGAPHYCINMVQQMMTDSSKIKQYDYIDQEPYTGIIIPPVKKVPTSSKNGSNTTANRAGSATPNTNTKTNKGVQTR